MCGLIPVRNLPEMVAGDVGLIPVSVTLLALSTGQSYISTYVLSANGEALRAGPAEVLT